jgi:microcystin-dependent protein
MEQYLGEIRTFSFQKVPVGWAACNGQILTIQQNQALFTLLGNKFGGDGKINFALPNLQGATAIAAGTYTDTSGTYTYNPGNTGGQEGVTLTTGTTPAHYHGVNVYNIKAAKGVFTTVLAQVTVPTPGNSIVLYAVNSYVPPNQGLTGPPPSPIQLTASAVSTTGAALPHNNMQPYLTMNICMAITGTYPPRAN